MHKTLAIRILGSSVAIGLIVAGGAFARYVSRT